MKHNRVLIFSTDDHLYPAGGAEQAMGNITERLPHIEFDLICAKLRKGTAGFEKAKNVNIYRMGFGIPRVDGIILALFGHYCAYKLMRKHSYDLMWSIMASYGGFSAVRIKRQYPRIPFLLTLQEGDSFKHIRSRVRFVMHSFHEIFRFADGLQAISKHLQKWGREMGYSGKHDVVIPNGVAFDLFGKTCDESDIKSTRASFNFAPNAFILMTSSRIVKKNGLGDVVKALSNLPENVCFVICGDGDLEPVLRAEVTSRGLTARVLFKGFVEPQELPLLMKASDAFIRPSLTEGLGTAFLEAMAARIPVIATTAGGIADFLTDGATGFVVGIEDSESIVKAVLRVQGLLPEQKTQLLNRAETMVRERYNWNLVSKNMEALFNNLTV